MGKKPSRHGSTIIKIAEEAGVSPATVSRVFNGSDLVRPELAQQILKIAEENNYTPRQAQRRDTIVLVVENTTDRTFSSYVATILKQLVSCCAQERLRLDIVTSDETHLIRPKYIKGVVGLLWRKPSLMAFKKIKGAPLVAINCLAGNMSICADERQGIELALGYLTQNGHRSIGLITREVDSYGDQERRKHFRELMKGNAHSDAVGHDIQFDGTGKSLLAVLAKLLRGRSRTVTKDATPPSALIATSEDTGIQLMHCLDLLGLRVPDDISIISHEAPNQSEYLIPAHTTVMQDAQALVASAIAALEHPKDKSGSVIYIPYQLNERDSVAPQ